MRRTFRAALLAGAALTALAFTGSALASFTPKLVVSPVPAVGGGVSVTVNVGNNDDPTAKVSIYVPRGYGLVGGAATGTKLGSVTATASAADLGGAVLPLTGEVDVADPTAPAIVATAMSCGTAGAAAVWVLHLTAAGQVIDVPLFVVATAGLEQTLGAYKLVVCLPPPDVPVGTPGRATFGAKLLSAAFTTSALASPTAAGDLRWTSLWTPYTPLVGTVNAMGSVETQSIVHFPARDKLTVTKKRIVKIIKGHKVVRTRVSWKTSVTENGQAVTGAAVTTTAGGKRVGGASGSFLLVKGTVTVASKAVIAQQELGPSGCVATAIFGGLPCIDATVGAATLTAKTSVTAYRK